MPKYYGGRRSELNLVEHKVVDLVELMIGGFIRFLTRLPAVHRWHPWFRADRSDMRWLPVNEDIVMPENTALPVAIIDRFIEEASHRVVIDFCGCRNGFRCDNYPSDIGCLMLGDSAMEIRNYPCREVDVVEAREHVRKAVAAGLVPAVGKTRADNYMYRIKDHNRLSPQGHRGTYRRPRFPGEDPQSHPYLCKGRLNIRLRVFAS